jgi:hypothetical protein
MTPHGVTSVGAERALAAQREAPHRHGDDSLWIQFESTLPMQVSPVAQRIGCRIQDWPTRWGAYRKHFRTTPD